MSIATSQLPSWRGQGRTQLQNEWSSCREDRVSGCTAITVSLCFSDEPFPQQQFNLSLTKWLHLLVPKRFCCNRRFVRLYLVGQFAHHFPDFGLHCVQRVLRLLPPSQRFAQTLQQNLGTTTWHHKRFHGSHGWSQFEVCERFSFFVSIDFLPCIISLAFQSRRYPFVRKVIQCAMRANSCLSSMVY